MIRIDGTLIRLLMGTFGDDDDDVKIVGRKIMLAKCGGEEKGKREIEKKYCKFNKREGK